MDLVMKIVITWLLYDVFLIATAWWFESTLRPLFPGWWKANICDLAPADFD